MKKEKKNLRDELRYHKFEFDLLQKISCTKQENKVYSQILKQGGTLPDGVFAYIYDNGDISTTDFYTVYESDLSEAEIREYLAYKQLSLIKSIKNYILFFVILTVIGMVITFLTLMNAFSL